MLGLGLGLNYFNRFGAGLLPPTFTVNPQITGTAVVGQTLTVSYTLGGGIADTVTRKWYRGATLIFTSTTSNDYPLVQADAGNTSNIKCNVEATNTSGSVNADSNVLTQILDSTWNDFKTTLSISDSSINNAMNTYIISRKLVSATTSISAYPFVGGTATTHSRNLYNSADSNSAKRVTWSGTITHDANGVQGNGTNGMGNTFINISTDFTSTDFTCFVYARTNMAANSSAYGALNASAQGFSLSSRWSDNNTYIRGLASAEVSTALMNNSSGFILIKRSGNTITLKRNNTTITSWTVSGDVRPNLLMYILALNLNGTTINYSTNQFTHMEFLNFATTTQQDTDLYNAVLAKETALSRNV